MVARILTGKSIRGLIHYNESKVAIGTAVPILANRFGLDIEQLELHHKVARFEHLTKLNSRVRTNAVHIMLNFDPSDKLDAERMQRIAVDYMDRIGFGEQPFLAYRHEDTNHPHIHIVTTNVSSDGTRIEMHNIGKNVSEEARRGIEVQHQLIKAEGRGSEQEIVPIHIAKASYGNKETKKSIYNVVTAVLRSYKFTSFNEYRAVLKSYNILADRGAEDSVMFQKNGLIYSILDANGDRMGIPFKASSFAGNPTLGKVQQKFAINLEKRKRYAEPLKRIISEILEKKEIGNVNDFAKALQKKGIIVVLRQNGEGQIYGITYIDHTNRCVFNGSDLGKLFSAKSVLKNLHPNGPKTEGPPSDAPNKIKEQSGPSTGPAQEAHKTTGEELLRFLLEGPEQEPISAPAGNVRKKKKKRLSKNSGLTR